MKSLIFIWLVLTTACFAGYDYSIEARVDGWEVAIDTAGTDIDHEKVVTRVFLNNEKSSKKATMELPEDALMILWEHLNAIPKTKQSAGSLPIPKGTDEVVLVSDRLRRIEPSKALPLIRLWLDTNRRHWVAQADPELQEALRGERFPPVALASKTKAENAEQGGTGQPATRSESDSEGSHKPQPESEGRSR